MVRKSERIKPKGTPEKTLEKSPRKSGRHSRRRRKSSSESEPDQEVSVEDVKESVEEVKETPEAKPQKSESPERNAESEAISSGSTRSKRVTRRQAAESADANAKPQSTEKEWKEDETFWSSEGDTTVGTSEAKPKEDEGSLWKVQSANGSSGEIQKIKICRQRTADASESSPTSAKDSPRRKRSSRSGQGDSASESEPNTCSLDAETPSSTVPDQSEPVPADSTDTQTAEPQPSDETTEKSPEPEEVKSAETEDLPSQSDDQPPTTEVVTEASEAEEKSEEVQAEETPNSTEDIQPPVERVTVSRSSPDKEVPDSSTRRKRNASNSSDSTSESGSSYGGERKKKIRERKSSQSSEGGERKSSQSSKGREKKSSQSSEVRERKSSQSSEGEERKSLQSSEVRERKSSQSSEGEGRKSLQSSEVRERKSSQSSEGGERKSSESSEVREGKSSQSNEGREKKTEDSEERKEMEEEPSKAKEETEVKERNESAPSEEESAKEATEPQSEAKEDTTKSNSESRDGEKSDETSQEEKVDEKKESTDSKSPDDSQKKVARQPVAKKPKEKIQYTEDKTNKHDSSSKEKEEKDSPPKEKEEGELSPVRKENRAHPRILVINKPQEHYTTKPTILKRKTDETPPQRKRRLTGERKTRTSDEASLTISSQSLKLLVPDAKPLAPEEVDLSYGGGEGEGEVEEEEGAVEEEVEQEAIDEEEKVDDSKSRKVELKARDMEIRVKNDIREVTKKEPIRVERKPSREEKGKDTAVQENHKGQPLLDKVQRKEKISVKVNTNDTKFMRKISIVSDDAKKLTRSPSPAGRKPTAVLFITNLVRPFTAPQLRELLARTGTIAPNGFYIDKIKSKCYVKYTEVDMAVETRHALHGVRWPVNNPKTLKVEFASAEDMAVVQELAEDETKKSDTVESGWLNEQAALKPMRRVTAGVREWDVGKVTGNEGGAPVSKEDQTEVRKRGSEEEWGRNKERGGVDMDSRRRDRPHTPEHKDYPVPRKMKRRDNDAPSKLLDDLFRKTKTTPCIYWLPLTASQIVIKEGMRRQHMAEHERRLAEIRKSEQSRRDRERERRKK